LPFGTCAEMKEETMPVIILWGIPTLLVLAGGGYYLVHMHH
jgi:cytochrome c-type biogenesis protein CcmH/NrfF